MAIRLYDRLTNPFPQRAVVRLDADDTLGKESKRHLVSALKQLGATGVDDADDAAQLLTRLRELVALPESEVFLRGLRAWVGFRQTGVDYVRPERMVGRSTNNFPLDFMLRQAGHAFGLALHKLPLPKRVLGLKLGNILTIARR